MIRQGQDRFRVARPGQPACPVHGYALRVGSTVRKLLDGERRTIRYLYCPCPECREARKQVSRN